MWIRKNDVKPVKSSVNKSPSKRSIRLFWIAFLFQGKTATTSDFKLRGADHSHLKIESKKSHCKDLIQKQGKFKTKKIIEPKMPKIFTLY